VNPIASVSQADGNRSENTNQYLIVSGKWVIFLMLPTSIASERRERCSENCTSQKLFLL
jgi:hypothetical protein